jgi:hypothetical protein
VLTMKKEMVGNVPGNVLGMLEDLLNKIRHGIITVQELTRFLKRENPFEDSKYHKLVREWEKFYQKVFSISVDLSQVRIPEPKEGFNWLVIMAPGFDAQHLYLFDKCKELFRAWKWTDKNLDEITKSDRNQANGTYAVWFRDRVEADEELKNLSANDLKQKNIPGITLEERLLLELFFYWKTKKHLDINNVTLCSGSRYDDGHVPHVRWNGCNDRLHVSWYYSDAAHGLLRSREVVS